MPYKETYIPLQKTYRHSVLKGKGKMNKEKLILGMRFVRRALLTVETLMALLA